MWYIESNKVPQQFLMPPGYHPTATAVSAMRAGSEASIFTVFKNPAPLPEYIERGLVFAGNPAPSTGGSRRCTTISAASGTCSS